MFFQKIRRHVLVSYLPELRIYLIIPNASLKFSLAFQNIEAGFERGSTKIVVHQNDVMKRRKRYMHIY